MTHTTKTQLLAGVSALAIVATFSVPALAADFPGAGSPIVANPTATQYIVTGGNGETLAVGDGGNIIPASSAVASAAATNTFTGSIVTITETTAGNFSLGINQAGGAAAIDTSDGTGLNSKAGTYASITVTGGQIGSANTTATSGTIALTSTAAQTTKINLVNSNSTITNSGAAGNAIYIAGTNSYITTSGNGIANAGTISETGGAGNANYGVKIAGNASTVAYVDNTGTIQANGTGAAIALTGATAAVANITNTAGGQITNNVAGQNAITIASTDTGVSSITQSGATSAITGGIDLGGGATSSIAVNGGTITTGSAGITMRATGQVLTLGGGQVVGAIAGNAANNGQILISSGSSSGAAASTYALNGAISNMTKVTVADGITLDTTANNNTIAVGTGHLLVGNSTAGGAVLNLGTGAVTGTIEGDATASSATNAGTVNFKGATNTLGGAIGSVTALATVNIYDGKTVTAGANNITAAHVYVGNSTAGGTLSLGGGTVTGLIDSASAGTGTLNFTATGTTGGDIGSASSLAAVNVSGVSTVTLVNNLKATTITVGDGTNAGVLTLNGAANAAKTITGNVVIAASGTFNQNVSGSGVSAVTGTVNGASAGVGTYALTNTGGTAGTFTTNNDIGTTKLLAFTTADNITSNISKNITATTTTFGGGASGSEAQTAGTITATTTNIGAGNTFTQTGGSVVGNVVIGAAGHFAINSGGSGITGTIDGSGAGVGILDLATTFTTGGVVGGGAGLAAINVNSGGSLTLGAATKATLITVASGGTLNLGTAGVNLVTGGITGTGTGTIDLGTLATHTETGNFTVGATNTIMFTVSSATVSGKLAITGTAALTAGVNEVVNVASSAYIPSGTSYTFLTDSGNGADNNAGTISVNSPVFTVAEDLSTNGSRKAVLTRVANGYGGVSGLSANSSGAGTVLEALGVAGNANAQIVAFLGVLDGSANAAALNNNLKTATPQINQANPTALATTTESLNVVSTRLSNLRAGIDTSASGMAAGGAVADKGIWIQGFGTTATQDQRGGVDGFNATTGGAAFGADMSVFDNSRVGLSFSYAKSSVDGNGTTVSGTDIDSYQINAYGSRTMGQWYADGLLGGAYHVYNGTRNVAGGLIASSGDYNGETYTARLGGGYHFAAGNGFDITPNSSLTYSYNHTEGYTETGAGGLDNTVGSSNTNALIGRIGADVGRNYTYDSMLVRPVLRAAYLYDFIGDQQDTTSQFTGGGATFKVKDASPARSAFDIGASLNVARTDNISFSADYDFEVKSQYTSHSGVLRARYNF